MIPTFDDIVHELNVCYNILMVCNRKVYRYVGCCSVPLQLQLQLLLQVAVGPIRSQGPWHKKKYRFQIGRVKQICGRCNEPGVKGHNIQIPSLTIGRINSL